MQAKEQYRWVCEHQPSALHPGRCHIYIYKYVCVCVCVFRAAKERRKPDRVVFECQERAYWVVHRPPVRTRTCTCTRTRAHMGVGIHQRIVQISAACLQAEPCGNRWQLFPTRVSNYLHPRRLVTAARPVKGKGHDRLIFHTRCRRM